MKTTSTSIAKTLVLNNDFRQKIIQSLFWAFVASLALYFFFVVSIVVNVVVRTDLENENKVISSDIASMQLTYLNSLGEINESYAKSLGFVDATQTAYVTKKSLVTNIGVSDNGL